MEILLLVEKLLDLIVTAVGPEKAQELLSARAVNLANQVADIVERERWPQG
jgi:hypothetical protein